MRREIEVIAPIDKITNEDEKGGIDAFKIPVGINIMNTKK
jgi:hypothetical protein